MMHVKQCSSGTDRKGRTLHSLITVVLFIPSKKRIKEEGRRSSNDEQTQSVGGKIWHEDTTKIDPHRRRDALVLKTDRGASFRLGKYLQQACFVGADNEIYGSNSCRSKTKVSRH